MLENNHNLCGERSMSWIFFWSTCQSKIPPAKRSTKI